MNWQTLGVIFQIIVTCINVLIFIAIKFNDLRHLGIAVKSIETKIDQIQKDQTSFKMAIAVIRTKCKERHERKIK